MAEAMTAPGGRVPAAAWEEARRHWSETGLVEVAGVAAAFAMFNRLANALEVDVTK